MENVNKRKTEIEFKRKFNDSELFIILLDFQSDLTVWKQRANSAKTARAFSRINHEYIIAKLFSFLVTKS